MILPLRLADNFSMIEGSISLIGFRIDFSISMCFSLNEMILLKVKITIGDLGSLFCIYIGPEPRFGPCLPRDSGFPPRGPEHKITTDCTGSGGIPIWGEIVMHNPMGRGAPNLWPSVVIEPKELDHLEIIMSFRDQRIASTSFLVWSSIDCFSRAIKISSITCIYSPGLMFIPRCMVGISFPEYGAGPPLPALKKATVCSLICAKRSGCCR